MASYIQPFPEIFCHPMCQFYSPHLLCFPFLPLQTTLHSYYLSTPSFPSLPGIAGWRVVQRFLHTTYPPLILLLDFLFCFVFFLSQSWLAMFFCCCCFLLVFFFFFPILESSATLITTSLWCSLSPILTAKTSLYYPKNKDTDILNLSSVANGSLEKNYLCP